MRALANQPIMRPSSISLSSGAPGVSTERQPSWREIRTNSSAHTRASKVECRSGSPMGRSYQILSSVASRVVGHPQGPLDVVEHDLAEGVLVDMGGHVPHGIMPVVVATLAGLVDDPPALLTAEQLEGRRSGPARAPLLLEDGADEV